MTDGGASLPLTAINAFKKENTFRHKIDFHAVGFGREAEVKILQKIAN